MIPELEGTGDIGELKLPPVSGRLLVPEVAPVILAMVRLPLKSLRAERALAFFILNQGNFILIIFLNNL